MGEIIAMESHGYWQVPTLEERADIAEKHGMEALLYCRDRWAIRHYWVNRETGVVQRARCNRWECDYCGPRKVQVWRQLVEQAEPVLFLTLTKAGRTVEQARRALTTFVQALRRGSKGMGPNRVGARLAYLIEYFAVLERHANFERNGFHWHILIKGVDFIPYKEVIRPLWTSATQGQAKEEELEESDAARPHMVEQVEAVVNGEKQVKQFLRIGWIERIRNNKAIGYVVKYLMKTLSMGDRGKKEVKRERKVLVMGEDGFLHSETEMITEQVVSKAHRISYSRHFFPEAVAVLRQRLFAGITHDVVGEAAPDGENEAGEDTQVEVKKQPSVWVLKEREIEGYMDVEEYKRRRFAEAAAILEEAKEQDQQAYQRERRAVAAQISKEVRQAVEEVYRQMRRRVLLEALEDGHRICRRVLSMWDYRRKCLRLAS